MPFPYKTVLMTGATSGIGLALTERMVDNGIFVIANGRRKDRLDALVQKHGQDKVAAEPFDMTDVDGLSNWVKHITSTYPNLDAVVLNAGLQRAVDFTNPSAIPLSELTTEVTTNYLAPLHAVALFLPHLIARNADSRPAAVVLVTSGLALVPIARCPNYCATKSAVRALAWTLRSQLSDPASPDTNHVRVIEIVPPAVQTELHDWQPDLSKPGQPKLGMPLDAFADETWTALVEQDNDEIVVQELKDRFGHVDDERRKGFQFLEGLMRKSAAKP